MAQRGGPRKSGSDKPIRSDLLPKRTRPRRASVLAKPLPTLKAAKAKRAAAHEEDLVKARHAAELAQIAITTSQPRPALEQRTVYVPPPPESDSSFDSSSDTSAGSDAFEVSEAFDIYDTEGAAGRESVLEHLATSGGTAACKFCFDGASPERQLYAVCDCKLSMRHSHLECLVDRVEQSQARRCPECGARYAVSESWYSSGLSRRRGVRLHNVTMWFVAFSLGILIFCAVGFGLAYAVRAVTWVFTRSFSYEIFGMRAGALPCPADFPVGGALAGGVALLALIGKTTRDQCRTSRPCGCDCDGEDGRRVYGDIEDIGDDEELRMLQVNR